MVNVFLNQVYLELVSENQFNHIIKNNIINSKAFVKVLDRESKEITTDAIY